MVGKGIPRYEAGGCCVDTARWQNGVNVVAGTTVLNVDEMNAQFSPILEQTKYSAAYLYIIMSGSVYE